MTKLVGVVVAGGMSSENRVFASLLGARRDAYDTRVLVHEGPGEDVAGRFAALSHSEVAVHDTGWRPSPYHRRRHPRRMPTVARYLRNIDRLVEDARDFRPDVVYSSQQHLDCRAASRIATDLGVPQIIHLHYVIGPSLQRPVLRRLREAEFVVTVSDFVRAQAVAHGVAEERAITIRNAMPPLPPADPARSAALRSALGLPAEAYTFGMVGRLDESKGHLDGIAAFERVAVAHPHLRLVIVGHGRIEAQVRRRIDASPAAHQILATGYRSDVAELLRVFDALMHPALADPCPLAVLEAMAAGLPVVGYRDGGMPELVADGATGLLADTGDVSQLTEAIRAVALNPDRSSRLGSAAVDRLVARFGVEAAAQSFADVVARAGGAGLTPG